MPLLVQVSRQLLGLARRYGRHAAFLHMEIGGIDDLLEQLPPEERSVLITRAATRISRAVRDSDIVARVGRDAFLVLLSDLWEAEASARVAERLWRGAAATLRVGGRAVELPVRVGVALYPSDGDHAEVLAERAAAAAHRIPAGTSGLEYHEEGLGRDLRGTLGMESDLRRDLSEGQFSLVYQPIFTLADGELCGAEALCRWTHRARGTLPAGEFIQLAERTGRIRTLDRFAVDEAATTAREWVRQGWHGWISVNLSGHSLSDPRLVSGVEGSLARAGLEPRHLVVEMTESAALREPRLAGLTLRDLRSLGVAIAVDDFGTGYSSFRYIHAYEVDILKLDRSFVTALADDVRHARVLEGLIQMSHHLEKAVVAEGIEEPQHRDWLGTVGCDMVQGYLFGRPMGAQEFEGRFL